MDGIPAFSCKTKSLKPFDFTNLSLSPVARVRVENMLLLMLVPEQFHHKEQKKYFDFAIDYELANLYTDGTLLLFFVPLLTLATTHLTTGVSGVKVKVFATSMDTPGRAELLGMEACNSYTPCCVCKHCFRPGIGSAKKLIFDGYRTFLSPRSRGRRRRVGFRGHVYEYYRVCARPQPETRSNQFVRDAVAFAQHRRAPYLGHKAIPLISRLPGFDWYRINTPDWMHGARCLCTTHASIK